MKPLPSSQATAPQLLEPATSIGTVRTRHAWRDSEGASLIEVLIMVLFICVMTSLAVSAAITKVQKAQLARCFADLRSIQGRVYAESVEGGLPAPETFWEVYWHGEKPGPYYYLRDDKADLDALAGKNVSFVVLCQHDHADLARYVFVEDDGPPTVANSTNDPHYDKHLPGKSRF